MGGEPPGVCTDSVLLTFSKNTLGKVSREAPLLYELAKSILDLGRRDSEVETLVTLESEIGHAHYPSASVD